MKQQDDTLERYLAEFRPRAVRNLEPSQRPASHWQRWLAAAAVVVCFLGTGYWQIRRGRPVGKVVELKSQTFLLTRIGLRDKKMLDNFLTEQSRSVLPSFQGGNSTLHVLAKE